MSEIQPKCFNKDELEGPQWLNVEFFTNVLRNHHTEGAVKVKNVKLSPATIKGDHYASIMFRATIEYDHLSEAKQKSMIIKTMPHADGHKKDMLKGSFLFETEIGIYTEVIPRFEKILRAAGDQTIFGAPCLYHSLTPNKVIIFEDICPLGYETLRDRPANIEEVKEALRKLAKWHALGYKLNSEEPSLLEKYCHNLMTMPNFRESDMMTSGIVNLIEMLKSNSVPALKEYLQYFEHIRDENILNKCQDTLSEYQNLPQNDAIYALCHGDFHTRNMMFKYDDKSQRKLVDVMVLDYQICNMGPIVNDLLYAKFLLLDADLRENHWDELLYYYFDNFIQTLKQIGYTGKVPKMVNLRAELVRNRHYEIFLLITFLPLWYASSEYNQEIGPEELLTSADCRRKLYDSATYQEELLRVLPKYLQLGYLEN